MNRERKLQQAGYRFTGHYASGSEGRVQMKLKAKELRSKGQRATVVHKIYHSRVTSGDGYSVYAKTRNKTTPKV